MQQQSWYHTLSFLLCFLSFVGPFTMYTFCVARDLLRDAWFISRAGNVILVLDLIVSAQLSGRCNVQKIRLFIVVTRGRKRERELCKLGSRVVALKCCTSQIWWRHGHILKRIKGLLGFQDLPYIYIHYYINTWGERSKDGARSRLGIYFVGHSSIYIKINISWKKVKLIKRSL